MRRSAGKPPCADHGVDVDAHTVAARRLCQQVHRRGAVGDRLFEIEFGDPGVQAFAFTFG